MLTIYSLPSYNKCSLHKCIPISNTIQHLLLLLETDKHYHERLNADMPLIFNIDLDNLIDFETFKNNLISYLGTFDLIVDQSDFRYTQNFGKSLPSYHFTIPKYYATSKTLKLFWSNFKLKYNYGSEIDFGHLGSKGKWFRLPHQAKEGVQGTEHIIIQGQMIDFILQHIPTESISLDLTFQSLFIDNNKSKTKHRFSQIEKKQILIPYNQTETNKEIIDLLQLIHHSRFDDYNKWIQMGMIIYSLFPDQHTLQGLTIWNELSKTSSKYKEGECAEKYRTFHSRLYNIYSLHYYARLDNPSLYQTFIANQVVSPIIEHFINITINKRYLTMDDEILNLYQTFHNDPALKCFSIKSPMDTGKSSFIMSILDKYQPRKVLFISFRKSLTYNIQSRLQNYGFQTYLEDCYDSDRLIIQIESLLKIENNYGLHIDNYHTYIPSYDLIIIDEIISVLNQFSSPTFKGKSKEVFEYLEQILLNSHKIITMDADYSIRSHDFLANFLGEKLIFTVYNEFVNNNRTLVFTQCKEHFDRNINYSLQQNKKIVIVSMASSDAEYYRNTIKQLYPDKNILLYIGDTDDTIKKEHFLHITDYWNNADVVIYSATIEAGVDFNQDYFDNIFCILQSDVSSSQRSLLQMLFRVRQIRNKDVLVLNRDKLPSAKCSFWTFDEVLEGIIQTRNTILEYDHVVHFDGNNRIRTKIVSNYCKCQVYNKVEQLNKNRTYFLPFLIHLAKQKGYTILFSDQSTDNAEYHIFNDKKPNLKLNCILDMEDINDHTYSVLIEKQQNGTATQTDKLTLTKHFYKRKLGVDLLDYNIMKVFFKKEHLIDNFIYLLNPHLIPNYSDDQTQQIRLQNKIVSNLLTDLGFESVFSTHKYDYPTFNRLLQQTILNNFLFKEHTHCRALFGLPKNELFDFSKNIGVFKYINSILSNYCIRLERHIPTGKRHSTKNSLYSISLLHGIEEIITYKIKKDSRFKLEGFEPTTTNKIYGHLLLTTPAGERSDPCESIS